jgi:hypothetical protein
MTVAVMPLSLIVPVTAGRDAKADALLARARRLLRAEAATALGSPEPGSPALFVVWASEGRILKLSDAFGDAMFTTPRASSSAANLPIELDADG